MIIDDRSYALKQVLKSLINHTNEAYFSKVHNHILLMSKVSERLMVIKNTFQSSETKHGLIALGQFDT